jgi:hypothetical protein
MLPLFEDDFTDSEYTLAPAIPDWEMILSVCLDGYILGIPVT